MNEDISEPQYISIVDWWRLSVGEKRELLFSPTNRSTQILSADTIRLLRECQENHTLVEHATRLCVQFQLAPDMVPIMQQQLSTLARAKLLVATDSLVTKLAASSPGPADPPRNIKSLLIPTRNRAEVFRRCVSSYSECAERYGRDKLSVHVMDQSDELGTRESNQQALDVAKASSGINSHYYTPADAEKFAREISKVSGVALEVVNFALVNKDNLPQAHGLSRNFLLLKTIGDLSVQVDDDTVCSVMPCREPGKSRLTLTSQYALQEFWFLTDSETSRLGSDGFVESDFFALHEQLLGRSLASCASEHIDFLHITSDFLNRLAKPNARVAATSVGVAGEAGMEGSFYFLAMEENSRNRLMQSELSYRFALNHNQVLRSVTSPTISSGSVITGHNQGVDNRSYLPPYFPLWRGEDMAFGELLGLSPEGSFNGYLPWHVLHKPAAPRTYSAEHLQMRASRLSFGAIMEALLQSIKLDRRRLPNKSIESVGQSLLDWGHAPMVEFEQMLATTLLSRASAQMLRFEQSLKQYDKQPAYWAADIEMCMNELHKSVVQKNFILGRDLESFYGLEQARKVQQLLVRQFGELLISWSSIRDAARHLRS